MLEQVLDKWPISKISFVDLIELHLRKENARSSITPTQSLWKFEVVIYSVHCRSLAVTATYFKRWKTKKWQCQLQRLKNKKDCPTLFISCRSDRSVSICLIHFHATYLLKQYLNWKWTPLLQNIQIFLFSTLNISFTLSGV